MTTRKNSRNQKKDTVNNKPSSICISHNLLITVISLDSSGLAKQYFAMNACYVSEFKAHRRQ